MKARKRVTKKGRARSVKASASESRHSPDWLPELSGLYRPVKKPVTLRLDADVLAWFKKQGSGYQTRINRALRGLMLEETK